MTQHRVIDYGERLPESLISAMEEFLSTMVSANFKITQASGTSVQVVAGADNDQVSCGINGRYRYITSTINRAHPGGGAGTYNIYAAASDNVFVSTGGEPPEIDETVYSFVLRIGTSPPDDDLYRIVGTLSWDGSQITAIKQIVGAVADTATPDVCVYTDTLSNPGGTLTATAPVTGTYIVAFGAGEISGTGQGSHVDMGVDVVSGLGGGHASGTEVAGGEAVGSVNFPGVAMTAGQVATLSILAGDATPHFVWLRLTRTA